MVKQYYWFTTQKTIITYAVNMEKQDYWFRLQTAKMTYDNYSISIEYTVMV